MIILTLFYIFFKIGAFTFGGGYAMIPLIQEEVTKHGLADSQDIIDFIAISESTPGPIAVNMATYIGSEAAGFWGSFFATLGVVLPSFIIILAIANIYEKFSKSSVVKGLMSGLKPTVIGLIASAVISVGATVFFPNGVSLEVFQAPAFYVSLFTLVLTLVLSFKKLHPILLIIISAIIGIITGYTIM